MPTLFVCYRRTDSPDSVKLIVERLKRSLPRWEIFYDHKSIPPGQDFPKMLRSKVASATAVLVVVGPKWRDILHRRRDSAGDHVRTEITLALQSQASVIPALVGHAAMPSEADLADFPDLKPLLHRNGRTIRPDPHFDGDLEPIIAHLEQLDVGEDGETIGAILAGKYTLTSEIGQGGMGVVFAAEQKTPVQRTVAIKLIKRGMDSREVLARFDAERQALAVMEHPNICKVLDAGIAASGRPFFVIEYVKGVPITKFCDERKLTPIERLKLLLPVCHAVQHAHQKGIIHRDLTPNNVLVEVIDGKPVPKVIDFGLAKALGQKLTARTLHTALGRRIGVLEYSSPEQAAGRPFDIDTRSDVYSLGVLLYELLTGAPPFTHAELLTIGEEQMRRHITEVVPAKPSKKLSSSGDLPAIAAQRGMEPARLPRLVNGDLDWIVMKCLEKEASRRYDTANQLGDELRRYMAHEPVLAGPPSMRYRAKKFLRRNRGPVVAAGLVVLALIAGFIGTSIGLFREAQQRAIAEDKEIKADRARDKAEESAKEAVRRGEEAESERQRAERGEQESRRRFYVSQIRLGEQLWERGEVLKLANLLRTLLPEPNKADLRGFEWYYLRQLAYSQGEFTLAGHGASVDELADPFDPIASRAEVVNALAVSPDGVLLAAAVGNAAALPGMPASKAGEVKVWELESKRVRFSLRGHTGAVTTVVFAPDGKALATGSTDGTVRLWDTAGKQTAILTEHAAAVSSIVYSPDGKWLATAANASRVFLREAATGKVVRSSDFGIARAGAFSLFQWNHLAFKPDSQVLAIGNGSGGIIFWDVTSGKTRLGALSDNKATALAFAPDGKTLAVNGNTPRVNLIDLRTGEVRASLQGHSALVTALAFSPEGGMLATGSADRTVKLWDTRTGRELATLSGFFRQVSDVAFSPRDSRLLIGYGDKVTAWDTFRRPGCTIGQGDGTVVRSLAFLPDSEELAAASGERLKGFPPGEIKFWHTSGGWPSRIFQGTHRNPTGVTISPDGATLAVSFGHLERLQAGGEVGFYDLTTGQRKHVFQEPTGAAAAPAYSPDRKLLAIPVVSGNPFTGSSRTRVKFLDGKTGTPAKQETSIVVDGIVIWHAFLPDGRRLATCTLSLRDQMNFTTLQLWEVATGALLHTFAGEVELITNIALSPDGSTLASSEVVGKKRFVRLWDVESGKTLRILDEATGSNMAFTHVAFSPDGQSLAIATGSGAVRVLSIADGAVRLTLKDSFLIRTAAFSPDGKYLATAGLGADLANVRVVGAVRLWDATTGEIAATFQGYVGFPNYLVFSADSKTLVTQGQEGTVAAWDVTQARRKHLILGQDLPAMQGHMEPVISIVAAPDGKTLYTGGRDKLIKVWDQATGRVRATLSGHTEPVTVLAVSPDGKFLATGSGGPEDRVGRTVNKPQPGELILWDAVTLTRLETVPLDPGWVGGLAFAADGKSLAVGIGEFGIAGSVSGRRATVRFWDPATRKELPERILRLQDGMNVDALAFDRTGSRLAVAYFKSEWSVATLNPNTGKRLADIAGHAGQIMALTFSPDGKTIATSGKDGLIKLWQASSGEELLTLRGHSNWVNGLAFSPKGDVLASGGRSGDGTHGELIFWNAPATLQRVWHYDEQTKGLARKVERYDDQSKLVEESYFDKDANLVAPPVLGCARKVFAYDDLHNATDFSCFDASGKLLLPRGVIVRFVVDDSQAMRLGIKSGDILRAYNGEPIRNSIQFIHARRTHGEGDLVFEREGVSQTVRLEAGLIGFSVKDDLSAPGSALR